MTYSYNKPVATFRYDPKTKKWSGQSDLYTPQPQAQVETQQPKVQTFEKNPSTNKIAPLAGKLIQSMGKTPSNLNQSAKTFETPLQARQRQLKEQNLADIQDLNSQYDTAGKNLLDQVPQLKETRDENIELRKKLLSSNKENIQTQTGQDLRQLAQSKRETDAQRQRVFASLGTIDSGGAMGYTGQQQNADSDFLREQAETTRQGSVRIKQLEDQADLEIKQELDGFDQLIAQINQAYAGNEVARTQAIKQAFSQLQTNLYDIQDKYDKQQFEVEQIEAKNRAKESAVNPVNETKGQMVSIIDEILNLNTKPITGALRGGTWIPGSSGQYANSLYNQLRGMLSLQNRSQLKGQGAISDFEFKVLEQAASALNGKLSDEDFRQVLNNLKTQLGGLQNTGGTGSAGRFTIEEVQ